MNPSTPRHCPSPSLIVPALLLVFLVALPELAHALDAKPLPYEEGLGSLYTSLTGPVPFIISLVGIVACGAMLIFGGEISGFLRTMVFLVLVISVIVQATAVVSMFGGNWQGKSAGATQARSPLSAAYARGFA
ncbi:TrbC/VirB2 family protein [Luteibacter sp. ME-Dv--P-043b]|uniref:TrbC/VirB2 family protein n=1 Tax=Luteibacter sp. ME-Dv--P-043b TaxID=3040291 RepID=UPI0025578913|nr:TrbC/VirB2 family protein [Luteibacter sp. ME-Dv--P-043b]